MSENPNSILENIIANEYLKDYYERQTQNNEGPSLPSAEGLGEQPKDKHGYGIKATADDTNDWATIRHNRERDEGFEIGKYIQTPPILFTRDAHNVWLGDIYKGSSAFLILGGPSFAKVNKDLLNKAGVLTMGVNNSVKSFRPNLWVSVDDPTHFIKSIWLDPKIMKFVPICHSEKPIFDNERWMMMDRKVGDCPNVLFYRRNENFNPDRFLWENTLNWGNHSKYGGGRSVFLPAIRILFYLGVRKIYLLGCDLKMDTQYTYHFDQKREAGSVKGNNSTYEKLKNWFALLKPKFESEGLKIYNCNFDSELKVFEFKKLEDAVRESTIEFPRSLEQERTNGLYDRASDEKKKK